MPPKVGLGRPATGEAGPPTAFLELMPSRLLGSDGIPFPAPPEPTCTDEPFSPERPASSSRLPLAARSGGPKGRSGSWSHSRPAAASTSLARILAEGLARKADALFFVENRPGASGVIAIRESIASADGQMFLAATSGNRPARGSCALRGGRRQPVRSRGGPLDPGSHRGGPRSRRLSGQPRLRVARHQNSLPPQHRVIRQSRGRSPDPCAVSRLRASLSASLLGACRRHVRPSREPHRADPRRTGQGTRGDQFEPAFHVARGSDDGRGGVPGC